MLTAGMLLLKLATTFSTMGDTIGNCVGEAEAEGVGVAEDVGEAEGVVEAEDVGVVFTTSQLRLRYIAFMRRESG